MRTTWSQFKTIIDNRNLDILMIEDSSSYYLTATENSFIVECWIKKTGSSSTDLDDFEDNYKAAANPKRQLFDSSGKPFARYAIAKEGNGLQCLNIAFKTSTTGSMHCKEADNTTDLSGASYTMYDVNGDVTTTNSACVLTVVDYEPPFDFEIVGGMLWQQDQPTGNIYAYMVGVPDLPQSVGGSHGFCTGGFNLKFIGANQNFGIDGKAPKNMPYSASLHTNKIRVKFYHDAGYQHDIMFQLRYYKPMVV